MPLRGHPRLLVAHADGPDGPSVAPAEVGRLLAFDDYDLLTGWITRPHAWLADGSEHGVTVMANAAMARPVNEGRFRYLPVRQSAVPRLLADVARPDIVVVSGVRRGNRLAFAGSVGWADVAAAAALSVVVQVDEDAPDLGAPLIPGPIALEVPVDDDAAVGPDAPRDLDDVDRRIGKLVAELVPHDATLQVGPGAIAEALLAELDEPVAIWSGLVTDAVAGLHERGLLRGDVTAAYVWGGDAVAALADAGRLRLRSVTETHDLTRVSAIERFVACNAALQVGLDGSVNIERVGGRTVSGIGGHPDYCAAASRSPGGLSIVALRSTTRAGASTIVPTVEVVSTPRCDVDIVVTEHGCADLRGLDDAGRAAAIRAIADPSARDELTAREGPTAGAAVG